ncbi:MAG: restriction endonuclease subunit S [Bacteroidetes bacterium]|nr:restriction endonuclease subunit S [Bacteroidota bacterium]
MSNITKISLDTLIRERKILLGRGEIISRIEIEKYPGNYPVYSSSAHNNGKFGEYGKYLFDEELITWSVDGGGDFFYRPKHKFSVTNVSGFLKILDYGYIYKFIYYSLFLQHRFLTFDYTTKAHPSVIRKLYHIPQFSRTYQQKIAEILTTIDIAIEKTEDLIKKYKQIKSGLMHDLFTRGVLPDGKLRPPKEEAPELYKETTIGWIPKEWDVNPLNNEVRIIDCKHLTPSYKDSGIPVIRPRNINDDGLDFADVEYVDYKTYLQMTDIHKPGKADIVYSRNASFGIPCYVETEEEFAIGQDVVVMTKKKSNTRFIYYVLKSNIIMKQIMRLFAGSTFGRINLGDIRELRTPIPPINQQHLIIGRLTRVDGLINHEKEKHNKLIKKKFGLMHDLLTGKVSVKVNEEVLTDE